MFIRNARNAISKFTQEFKADFEEVEFFPSPTLPSDRSSSQTTSIDGSSVRTSLSAVLQNPASRDDLPAIPSESSEDEDDSNGQLQKRNLFQSLQHNASSLSITSGTSSRAQFDSSKLNTKKKPRNSFSSNHSTAPSTYSNHSEPSQLNPSMTKTLPPDPKRNEVAKGMFSSILRTKKSMKLGGTHHDTTNNFAQPMTMPKSPVDSLSVTPSPKTTIGNGVSSTPPVTERPESLSNSTSYPKPTSASHHSHDVPTMQLSVTPPSQSHKDSVVHNDNLDDPQNTSETSNRPDFTPITQSPPLTSKKLEGDIEVVEEISAPNDLALDKPSTSPNTQSPPLNSITSASLAIQSPPLNSTPSTSPNTQSPLNSTTSATLTIQSPPLNSTPPTSPNSQSPQVDSPARKVQARRKPDINSFLLNLVTRKVEPENAQPPKTQPQRPPLRSLQRISESGDSLPFDDFTPAPDDILARRMEELGRLRRMESRNLISQSKTSPDTLSPRTAASPKAEIRPQLQTLQEEDNSSDVSMMLKEAYIERQQALQTQLDKTLAELRDVQLENKRLTGENRSQQRSISQLKIALDEAKHEKDDSLIQINNQLRVANSSLTLLNKEKKGWQDKLDSMQDKITAAERHVRCLDHLTRHKLESRQEAGYGLPKRRGQFASIYPASTDVIGAIRALNEEIYQTCVQFVEGLERTIVVVPSRQLKTHAQKVLGVHLISMMEDQGKNPTSGGYNMLLMQTVLEVFMTHWCSSIIEAFYPQQESFADLLVQLSSQTPASGLGLAAICGKQIKIIQSSTHYDSVKFNEWVNDIIKELGLFLTVAGVRMKSQSATLFSTKTLALVKVAYDLRTAMAEKDICGGLEIVIVPPDTAFQEKWMIDAYGDYLKLDADQSRVDYVAGTTGMGLQRKVSETVDGQFQSRMEIELKPRVTLAQALKSQPAKPIKFARPRVG